MGDRGEESNYTCVMVNFSNEGAVIHHDNECFNETFSDKVRHWLHLPK